MVRTAPYKVWGDPSTAFRKEAINWFIHIGYSLKNNYMRNDIVFLLLKFYPVFQPFYIEC